MNGGRWDVLVIGAGPAGSSAAWAAASRGARVLVIDRKRAPGEPVQCGEWVPRLIRRYVPVPPEAVALPVDGLRTWWWQGGDRESWGERWGVHEQKTPGYMLYRAAFDRHLLNRAQEAGATVWLGAGAVGLSADGVWVMRAGESLHVRARVVVGADGARSQLGAWIGSRNREFVLAAQYELACAQPAAPGAFVEVYLHPRLAGGYGWFFPKGATANVGVGINPALAPRAELPALLRWFVAALEAAGKVQGRPLRATGGWLPVGGLLPRVAQGRFLLAGDAAGVTHPITGAGIYHAVISGTLAGAAAAAAVREGYRALQEYPRRLSEQLGDHLAWAVTRRRERDRSWHEHGDFPSLVHRSWVTLPGFQAGRREYASGGVAV